MVFLATAAFTIEYRVVGHFVELLRQRRNPFVFALSQVGGRMVCRQQDEFAAAFFVAISRGGESLKSPVLEEGVDLEFDKHGIDIFIEQRGYFPSPTPRRRLRSLYFYAITFWTLLF